MINKINNLIRNKKILILLDQILVSGSNFLLGILLARFLGLELFGQFSLIWLLVLFFSSVQLAFIISPMLTHGAKKIKGIIDYYLSNIILFQILFILVSIFVLYIFLNLYSFFTNYDFNEIEILILFLVFSFLGQDFMRRYLIIKESYFKLLTLDIVAYLGQLLLISILVYRNELTLENTIISLATVFLVSYLISLLFVKLKTSDKKYMRLSFLKNWNFSKWLVYSSILQWGSGSLFILVSGYILGPWAVGVIRIMQNTMGVFHVLFIALENILPIKFSEIYKKEGYSKTLSFLLEQLKFGLIFIFVLIIILVFTYKQLILFIYGSEYISYSYLIFGFMIMYIFIYAGMLQRYLLRTIENTKVIFINYIYTSIFSIISSFILINLFELNGAILGMILTQIISNIIFYIEIKKFHRNTQYA